MKGCGFRRLVASMAAVAALAIVAPQAGASSHRKPHFRVVSGFRPHVRHGLRFPSLRAHIGSHLYRPYASYFYRPYFYRPYFLPYGYGYYGPYDWRYGYVDLFQRGGGYGYGYDRGAVRTLVEPPQTEVYVDGYYAGAVDDFDGLFQRLYLEPGEHRLEFRLDGYRDFSQSLHVTPGRTFKIHHRMEPLAPGEENAPRSAPPEERHPRGRPEEYGREPGEPRSQPKEPPRQPSPPETGRPASGARFGILSVRVQPQDARVIIDGQPWGSMEGFEELPIHLAAGRHRIEIQREGYESFVTEIELRAGETAPLNVRLSPSKKL